MSIEKTKDGRWQVRWREPGGRQRARRFARRVDAADFESMVRVQLNRGEYVPTDAGSQLLVDVAGQWQRASLHWKPATAATYRRDLDRYIFPALGAIPIRRVSAPAVQDFLAAGLAAGLAPSSVNRHYRTVRALFAWAIRQRIVAANPCDAVTPPRSGRKDVRYLTAVELERLVDAMPDRYRVLVLVAGYGGFRWSELVGLRRSSIDGARVLVAEQLQQVNGAWLRDTPKSASSRRVVTLPASVAAELAGHLEEFSQVGPDGLVFVNRLGNPVGPSFRGNVWYPACARAGLATRTHRPGRRPLFVDGPDFHDLRHTAVALSISAGAHPKTIQSMLGHSSIAVTMNTYGHLLEGVESSLADDLDRMRPRPDAAG